jgi:exonuclease III
LGLDTVNYIGENNPKSKLEIHQMINSMDLVDVWRDKNPGVRRYTWRGPNKKQSRLDYFLVFTFLTNSSSLNRLLLNFHVPLPLV